MKDETLILYNILLTVAVLYLRKTRLSG
jgi:hypothetical protein